MVGVSVHIIGARRCSSFRYRGCDFSRTGLAFGHKYIAERIACKYSHSRVSEHLRGPPGASPRRQCDRIWYHQRHRVPRRRRLLPSCQQLVYRGPWSGEGNITSIWTVPPPGLALTREPQRHQTASYPDCRGSSPSLNCFSRRLPTTEYKISEPKPHSKD